jgi:peptidoglycan/xylan/chitin deacetylase (PgdA/CDA1 family)
MYHSIGDNPVDPHSLHPDIFARQMEELSRRRVRVVGLLDALNEMRQWRKGLRIVITFDDAYSDFLTNAAPVLKEYGYPATVFAPTGLLGGNAAWDSYDKGKVLMTWSELAELQHMGFSVGGHTVSHARLTECSESELERELRDSLLQLKEHLDGSIPVLSYPGGYFGHRESLAARKAGYMAAVGVGSRVANYPWTNLYALRRRRWL